MAGYDGSYNPDEVDFDTIERDYPRSPESPKDSDYGSDCDSPSRRRGSDCSSCGYGYGYLYRRGSDAGEAWEYESESEW